MKNKLFILLLPMIMYANIGKITAIKGDVKIERKKEKIQVFSGTKLEKNDFISTGKHSKIQIVFTDNTIFTVGSDSTLDISEYLYDETQPKKNKAEFKVLKGAFSSITGRIGKLNKSKFKLKTKSASIGIRGTIIKANQNIIMCTQGAASVTTNNGITINLEAGEKTDVSSGSPTKASQIQNTDTDIFNYTNMNTYNDTDLLRQNISDDDKMEILKKDENNVNSNTTLSSTTIDENGNIQNISVAGKRENGQTTISNTNFQKYDDSGNIASDNSIDTISWGKWNTNPTIIGYETANNVIDNLRNNTTTVNSTYNGQVLGSVKLHDGGGTDNIKIDANNAVQLNFQLGNNVNSMNGNIKFQTEANVDWNANFVGTTTSNNFSTTSISNNGSSVISTGSSLTGTFYGDDAANVGGSFILNNADLDKATGVFKASK